MRFLLLTLLIMGFTLNVQAQNLPVNIDNVHVGGTTPNSAIISGKAKNPNIQIQLNHLPFKEGVTPTYQDPINIASTIGDSIFIFKNQIDGLSENTEYFYRFLLEDALFDVGGVFRTFPSGGGNYKVIIGACAETGSEKLVFETIMNEKPYCYINIGDFHYANIQSDCDNALRQAYSETFNANRQLQLYRSTSFAYIWDDHDFGANNSAGHPDNDLNNGDGLSNNGTAPCTEEHKALYKENIAHYKIDDFHSTISQSFTIGRIKFMLTDLRSKKLRPVIQGCQIVEPGSNFGDSTHLNWFKQELLDAKYNNEIVAWISSIPFINGPEGPEYDCREDDNWGGYPEERRELTLFIEQNEIPLFMVSGDAHMLAIDDGTNSNYGSKEKGFPVFHTGALDKYGSVKGGPYSHGTSALGGQFGKLEVNDNGLIVEINFSGMNQENTIVESNLGIPLSFDIHYELPKKLKAPSNLKISRFRSGKIEMCWNDNSLGESGFQIESSKDSIQFTSTLVTNENDSCYTFTPNEPGIYYFRIKAISDIYVDSEYSDIVEMPTTILTSEKITNEVTVYPNPSNKGVTITVQNAKHGHLEIVIQDLTGQTLYHEAFIKDQFYFKKFLELRSNKLVILSLKLDGKIIFSNKLILK